MIERKQLLEEQLLRENIRKALRIVVKRRTLQEQYIRRIVKKLLKEGVKTTPPDTTGEGTLKTVLQDILTQLETEYRKLATAYEQRESYANHFLNKLERELDLADINYDSDQAVELEEAVEIDVGDEKDRPPEYIDLEDDEVEEEEVSEEEEFAAGMDINADKTGRDAAFGVWKSIGSNILTAYSKLHNEEDRAIFSEYLPINLKLHFEDMEAELNPNVPEPDIEIPAGSEEAAAEQSDEVEELGAEEGELGTFEF
tara:strand:+ start:4788 stop:5555 length:768 start_codon:yes stop_codon:yes gene_type:complete